MCYYSCIIIHVASCNHYDCSGKIIVIIYIPKIKGALYQLIIMLLLLYVTCIVHAQIHACMYRVAEDIS